MSLSNVVEMCEHESISSVMPLDGNSQIRVVTKLCSQRVQEWSESQRHHHARSVPSASSEGNGNLVIHFTISFQCVFVTMKACVIQLDRLYGVLHSNNITLVKRRRLFAVFIANRFTKSGHVMAFYSDVRTWTFYSDVRTWTFYVV